MTRTTAVGCAVIHTGLGGHLVDLMKQEASEGQHKERDHDRLLEEVASFSLLLVDVLPGHQDHLLDPA
jgi:hypothetical protein